MARRAFIPPVKPAGAGGLRGAGDIPTVPTVPKAGPVPGAIPKAGSASTGSDVPRLGKGDGDSATSYKPPVIPEGDALSSSPNQYGTGTASSSTSLCSRDKEGCDLMKDVAEELVGQIIDAAQDAAAELESSSVASGAATTTTLTAARMNTATSTPTPVPMPNLNVSSWMDLSDYSALFTESEFSMLQEDPLCFYANYERLYESYYHANTSAASPASSSSSASATSTTGGDPARRTVPPRPRQEDGEPTATATNTVDEDAAAASTLYFSYLPDQLRLVYTSTPASLTVTATATATCSGLSDLGIATSFETPYAVFGYREGYEAVETEAPVTSGSSSGSGEVSSGAAPGRATTGPGMAPWSGVVILGILWLLKLR
ncbi:hypothetical protein Daus18300_000572 [Diaporthe australafricana]|uniref:Uncharacterized protein n=1 Tax=Diaporthe australafricana TaxID=127596 RepID=A0ABR3Y5D2_9PEZI